MPAAAVRKSIDNLVEQLCVHFDVNKKYAEVITAKILDMIESRKFEKDFLHSIVHVSEVKILFLEFAQEARVEEKLDPMHEKWDEIECSDVRNIGEKFLSVCAEYEKDSLEELVDEYIDGAYEQSHHQNHRQVKAYNYRVYKTCKKLISRFLKEHNGTLTQFEVYEFIYKQAKSSIYVVDNYIGLRTLVHLKNSPAGVAIILFSDNVGNNKLHNIEFIDFCKEYPTVNLSMKKTGGIFHDRFIVLDYGTADERVFLCGASSKDAGARITSIVEDYGISKYAPVIAALLKNPTLILPH